MITGLCRYPVKGLSGENSSSLRLIANEGIFGDRAIAIARKPGLFDPDQRRTSNKNNFLMLMRDEALAGLETRLDEQQKILEIKLDGEVVLEEAIDRKAGRRQIEAFFKNYLHDTRVSPTVTRSPGYKFTDLSSRSPEQMRAISLINVNSALALEEAIGTPIDPRRFRSNIYFNGVQPFEEFNWMGKIVKVGSAELKVEARTKRCAATQVNPDTAQRDIDIPKELRKHFGHSDMGIYANVITTGIAETGDDLELMD